MKTRVITAVLLLASLGYAMSAGAADLLVRFEGGIGVIPVSSGTGAVEPANPNQNANVNRNVVRGVQPPGQIWVIADLRANVSVDGRIKVDGRGLLLGGGDNIGGTANQSVRAALFCGAGSTTAHQSELVPLEPNGDFRIDDILSPPVPSAPCDNPVLLIRNAGGAWFAAGIPKL